MARGTVDELARSRMNMPTLVLGIVVVVYGLYTAWARRARPGQFRKLERMKETFGERTGVAVHTVGYTLVPIAAGLVMIFLAVDGRSIF